MLPRSLKRHVKRVMPPRYVVAWRAFRVLEPELQYLERLVDPLKGCIDVGAHEGLYTYKLARLSPKVYSYEPNPEKARFLAHAFAGSDHVIIHPYAASSRNGHAVLGIPADRRNDRTQEATLRELPSAGFRVEIETRRLDSMGHQNIGFIKIDVEGHEEEVLDGARDLIGREQPVLLVEIERRHTGRDPRMTFRKIMEWGYSGFFLIDGEPLGIHCFVEEEHQNPSNLQHHPELYRNNFIFRPLDSRRGTGCPP